MTKQFHLGDILSITTGRLVSIRHIAGVYDILNYMTRDNLFTRQLSRASNECKPWLLRQHPQLAEVDASNVTKDNCDRWLIAMVNKYAPAQGLERLVKGWLDVEPIPQDDHERIHPYDELVRMRGTNEGIILVDTETGEIE